MSILQQFLGREDAPSKYYEIWRLHESWFRNSRMIVLTLAGFVLLLLMGFIYSVRRPPALIVVDELGKAVYIQNYEHLEQRALQPEIRYFVKTFLDNYSAPNSEKIYDQMARALNMMTPAFGDIHKEEIEKSGVIKKIEEAKIKTNLVFKKITIDETGESLFIEVLGISEVFPLKSLQSDPRRHGFKAQMRLVFCPRTEKTPHGLLVDDYSYKQVSLVTVEEGKTLQNPLIPE